MTLRHDLELLVADWPHTMARSALRIADVLAGKPDGYWSRTGRERVERELAEDGLSPERIDAVVLTIEGEPPKETDLDRLLADLIAREGHRHPADSGTRRRSPSEAATVQQGPGDGSREWTTKSGRS